MKDSSEVAFNLQAELKSAQSELSALREENERLKSESFEELYNAAIDERDALREELAQARDDLSAQRNHFRAQLADAKDADEIQQRLVAAEQRNSELLKAVEQSIEWFERISSGDGSGHADLAMAVRRIAKLPKPTESEASE